MLGGHLARVADAELRRAARRRRPRPGAAAAGAARAPAGPRRPPPVSDPETERRRLFGAVVGGRAAAGRGRPLLMIDRRPALGRPLVAAARAATSCARRGSGRCCMVGTYRDNELRRRHPLPETARRPRARPRSCRACACAASTSDEVAAADRRATRQPEHRPRDPRGDRRQPVLRQAARAPPRGGRRATPTRACRRAARRDRAPGRAGCPSDAGRVLGVAALIGRDFDLDLLERVVDLPEDELLDVLDAAVRAGILVEVAEHARALLVRPRAAAHDARGRAVGDAPRARCTAGSARRSSRSTATRLDPWLAELARHFAAAGPRGGRPRRRATPSAPPSRPPPGSPTRRPSELLAPAPGCGASATSPSTGRARPAGARAGRRARRTPGVGGGARELRPRRRRRPLRRRRALPSPARRSGTPAARGSSYGVEDAESVALLEEALRAAADGRLHAARAGPRPDRGPAAASSPRSPRPTSGRPRTRRSRWRAGSTTRSRWRRR